MTIDLQVVRVIRWCLLYPFNDCTTKRMQEKINFSQFLFILNDRFIESIFLGDTTKKFLKWPSTPMYIDRYVKMKPRRLTVRGKKILMTLELCQEC